jgi:hypothetical protein
MMSNEKPVFWASNTKLNEPEGILKEQGWRKGSRPAASDFNWLFHTMQKDIHGLKVELNELKEKISKDVGNLNEVIAELKTVTNSTKATAQNALSESVSNKKESHLVIHALLSLHSEMEYFLMELREYHPSFRGPSWSFKDGFSLVDHNEKICPPKKPVRTWPGHILPPQD